MASYIIAIRCNVCGTVFETLVNGMDGMADFVWCPKCIAHRMRVRTEEAQVVLTESMEGYFGG